MNVKKQNILAELQVSRLPSLPHVLIEMLEACQSSVTSFQDLAAIISRDAGVAARVVSLANSSFYSRGAKIDSIERALFILGTETVKTIVITASVQQFFSGFNQSQANRLKSFWQHSLSTALIAKSLAILTSYPQPDEAYLTGLLHNIGELVLENNFPTDYASIIEEPSFLTRAKKELALFSVDHARIGAHLVSEWGLSRLCADAIEYHHAPKTDVRDAHHLVKLIHLSGLLAEKGALDKPHTFDVADSLFELNASLVQEIVNKINNEVDEISASLDISFDGASPQDSDHEKQIELAKKVRNIGLLQTAIGQFGQIESLRDLELSFENSLKLIFGFNTCATFWFSPENNQLSCSVIGGNDQADFKIKVDSSKSLVAKAAETRNICTTYDHGDLSVLDKQLVGLMGSNGLVCIPIVEGDLLVCVLAAALNSSSSVQPAQHKLLNYFASEIASVCIKAKSRISAQNRTDDPDSLRTLAQEIAHEANNPLNIIGNYLATLGNKLASNSDVQEELSILKEEVERTGSILLRLKDLQLSSKEPSGDTDINNEISRLAKLYEQSLFLTQSIDCELKLDAKLKTLPINANSLRQILTNLIKNAAEAMVDGGRINISTSSCVNVNGLDYAEICIRDNGPGIDEKVLKNLFKPTTSTKGNGHSGLGLSITKNLVTEANGSISCRSNNEGSEFRILLPLKGISSN